MQRGCDRAGRRDVRRTSISRRQNGQAVGALVTVTLIGVLLEITPPAK
jgi:hypothetical protein